MIALLDQAALSRAALAPGGQDLQEIVNLLQTLCDAEVAAISVRDDGAFHYLVTAGVEPLSNPVELSLCEHSMGTPGPFVITDASVDERTRHLPVVDGTAMSLRFYASTPITHPDGTMVGRLCLFDTRSRHLPLLQAQTLVTLAESVSNILDLRLRRRELEQSAAHDERRLDLAARVSHDLRVPLTALATSLEMLEQLVVAEDAADPVVDRLVAGARRSTRRMTGLVDGLLRFHDGGRRRQVVDVALDRVVRRVQLDLRDRLVEVGAVLEVGELPVVSADADQVYSVLLNLVTNAVKFARPGVPPLVRITAERQGGDWQVRVSDNGIGVPADQHSRVFEMFTRLTTREGHGIGLATVAKVVDAHGGRLGLEGNADHGTTVWFTLPVAPMPEDAS